MNYHIIWNRVFQWLPRMTRMSFLELLTCNVITLLSVLIMFPAKRKINKLICLNFKMCIYVENDAKTVHNITKTVDNI